jgi:hypothetical protein
MPPAGATDAHAAAVGRMDRDLRRRSVGVHTIASPKGSDMSGRGWLVAIGSLEVRRGLRLGERTEPPRLHLRRIARRLSSAMRRRVAGPSMHTRPLSTFGPQRDIGADAGRTDNCERSDADRGEC